MEESVLYSDKLISINEEEITFHKYYFPTHSDKTMKYSDIKKIKVVKPSLINGKYRYWGTGDLLHWFPLDTQRSKREAIYILYKKSKRSRIGFTVENNDKVTKILKQKVELIYL